MSKQATTERRKGRNGRRKAKRVNKKMRKWKCDESVTKSKEENLKKQSKREQEKKINTLTKE